MTFADVREMVHGWPGVEDGTSYGTPALKVRGKLLTRLREDGETLVLLGVEHDERDLLIEARPDVFYLTDHYRNSPCVLARLPAAQPGDIEGLLLLRWRAVAPKRVVQTHETRRSTEH